MYYLEITKDYETSEGVALDTIYTGHKLKIVGYTVTTDWQKVYRIDEREYDGDREDLEQDLNYIKDELQKMLKDDSTVIWTRD